MRGIFQANRFNFGALNLTCARPVVSYALAPTKTKFVFFCAKRRIADYWQEIGPIQMAQIIARLNLLNILELFIFNK